MRLLIVGGTSFVGRHTVDAALGAGHEVTLANRGKTNAELFPDLERRVIDREVGDVEQLENGSWDATIDVTAYVPRHVAQLSSALADRAGRYVLVSTVSVYDTATLDDHHDEQARRFPPAHDTEDITEETYGPLKVACEDVAWSDFGANAVAVRPGIVAGPHDPTDRFTYWVRRMAEGRPITVPRRPEQPVQVTDARDLGAFLVRVAETDADGPLDAVGDVHPLAEFVRRVAEGVGAGEPVIEWVDPSWRQDFDTARQPLVLDAGWDVDGLFRRVNDRAKAAGLHVRPLTETAADTIAWDRDRGTPALMGCPTVDQDARMYEAWRTRS